MCRLTGDLSANRGEPIPGRPLEGLVDMDEPDEVGQALLEQYPIAMSQVCTPVSVVTTIDNGEPHGTTVSAFASLSLHPPMVLVSLDRQSDLLARVTRSRQFGLNVLASGQADLALRFAKKGPDTFEGLNWFAEGGCPRFDGVAVWLSCGLSELVDGGDHRIAFGTVRRILVSHGDPLTYHARAFGTHALTAPGRS
jgi:flavin reductase (DIM6/NTAB) family NADH-FMN oxidoreductase RutF